jgi:putative hydrolase of the HAD superfamily
MTKGDDGGGHTAPGRYGAVLLDAFGTLIELDDPVRRLRDAVAERLHTSVSEEVADRALQAEISYYATHCHEGRDASSLERLRRRCAATVLEELGIDGDPARAVVLLADSIRYRAYRDAHPTLAGLEQAGVPVAVVSNADCSLPDMLAAAGLRTRHVFSSAATGSSKPDPGIFLAALEALGVPAERTLHVGDTPSADAVGGLAAGVDVRIIDRARSGQPGTIASLTEILELIA